MKLQTINPGIERVTPSSRELDVLNGICSGGIKGFFTEPHLHEHYEELGNSARLDLSDLASLLLRLANHSGPCALVVGLGPESIKDAGQTPTEFIRPGVDNINPADPLRLVLNGLAGLYGFGYSSLQGGALITNVMPIEQLETTEGHSGNATKELGLHTEAASARSASADLSPDVLTLQFIRNPNNVPTTISIPDITTLPPDVIDLLSQPRYRILTNPAQGGSRNDVGDRVPILYRRPGNANLMFGTTTTRSDLKENTPKERAAVERFLELLEESRYEDLVLGPGDVAFIDNRRAAHGRPLGENFQPPNYDGNDRWQRRLNTVKDRSALTTSGCSTSSGSRVVDIKKLS